MENLDILDLLNKSNDGNRECINKLNNFYWEYNLENINVDQLLQDNNAVMNKSYGYSFMARLYLYGTIVEKNIQTAIDLCEKSMQSECCDGYYLMPTMVLDKTIDPIKFGTYKSLLNKSMELNNSNAYLLTAYDLFETIKYNDDNKIYINKQANIDKYIELLNKSINLENSNALLKLGQLYHDGEYVEKNINLACEYYNKGCILNNSHCYFNMAVMYREGDLPININKSIKLFKKSIELGNIKALTCLGHIYVCKHNYKNAKKYYKMAIEKNDPLACHHLSMLYENENKIMNAITILQKGSNLGCYNCFMRLNDYGISSNASKDDIMKYINFTKSFENLGAYDSNF